jgi:TPP-dependent pyruvate/acetoin dehydrogenase alpha subunit
LVAFAAESEQKQGHASMSHGGSALTEGELFALYERMLLIRRTEERLRDEVKAGNLPGAMHLYTGEEAIAAGVCANLRERDMITSTHRGHGHFLAKGGDLNAMMAEIWAKDTGICRGMGGSMHVADFSKGILGENGIVGAGFAIATGAAYSAMLAREGRVVVDFFGDGASNQGTLMECLNVASLRQLPLVFVCEHNTFSEFSLAKTVTSGEIVDRARAFKMLCEVIDGNDAVAVWQAAKQAVERGPQLVPDIRQRDRSLPRADPARANQRTAVSGPAAFDKDSRGDQVEIFPGQTLDSDLLPPSDRGNRRSLDAHRTGPHAQHAGLATVLW